MERITFVDCTTVVDDGVCNIPNVRFCPFYIRGRNMAGECMYWKARIKERNSNERQNITTEVQPKGNEK